jgi:NADH-quinone oxidoreductase subunit I
MAYGLGVVKGMGITLRHYLKSYLTGQKAQPAVVGDLPFAPPERQPRGGMPGRVDGLMTVEYPDEKLPVPERFRALPFLVYEDDPDSERAPFAGVRCTACGICAKVCPPQCIWIVQGKGDDGRPRPVASEFFIDASICMSCGLCAEFCPFDAIKMDHDYEISSYERHETWVYDIQELLHPLAYHAAIHPTDYARETAERRAKAEARRAREAAQAAPAAPAAASAAAPDAEEEARRKKAEARARFLADRARRKAEEAGEPPASGSPGG